MATSTGSLGLHMQAENRKLSAVCIDIANSVDELTG